MSQRMSKKSLHHSVEERMRTLRGLIKDIERYRQKASPPIGTNIKAVQSAIAGKLEERKTNYAMEMPLNTTERIALEHDTIKKKCDRYYKSLRQLIREHRYEQQKKTRQIETNRERIAEHCAHLRKQWHKDELHAENTRNVSSGTFQFKNNCRDKSLCYKRPRSSTNKPRCPTTTNGSEFDETRYKQNPIDSDRSDAKEIFRLPRESCSMKFPRSQNGVRKYATLDADRSDAKELFRRPRESSSTKIPRSHNGLRIYDSDHFLKGHGRSSYNLEETFVSKPTVSYMRNEARSSHVGAIKHKIMVKEITDAVNEGHSQDPMTNKKLASVVKKALGQNIPWPLVEKTINDVNKPKEGHKMVHLLQIQLGLSVYIMATVRTSDFPAILAQIDPYMHQCHAEFVPVLQHFTHCCCIEAILPKTDKYMDPNRLKKRLQLDAVLFKVNVIDIIKPETGEVSVKCDMQSMTWLTKTMEDRGYTILASDYGFKPRSYISLGRKNASNYKYFLNHLMDIPDIETICDNVM